MRRLRCTKGFRRRLFSTSVSEAELSKFTDLSKTWWDPRENPLIGMNPIRVNYIIDNMVQSTDGSSSTSNNSCPLSSMKILDVGSGGGILSNSLARLGAEVTAVEPSKPLIEQAVQHASMDPKTRTIDFKGGCTIEQLAAENRAQKHAGGVGRKYDAICVLEVLEHVDNNGVESMLSAARSLLKPVTGRLFVSTLNRTMKSKIVAIYGAEYVMRYLPLGTHDWQQFRSPNEVDQIMNSVEMKQLDVKGMIVTNLPLWDQWRWKLDPEAMDINWIGTYKTIRP